MLYQNRRKGGTAQRPRGRREFLKNDMQKMKPKPAANPLILPFWDPIPCPALTRVRGCRFPGRPCFQRANSSRKPLNNNVFQTFHNCGRLRFRLRQGPCFIVNKHYITSPFFVARNPRQRRATRQPKTQRSDALGPIPPPTNQPALKEQNPGLLRLRVRARLRILFRFHGFSRQQS